MNESSVMFQARFLRDSMFFSWLMVVKLFFSVISIPLLWKIRAYKTKVLVHQSLSILMKFHYYYILYLATSCTIDFTITLYSYQSSNVRDYILSCQEHVLRRYPQVVAIHGSVSTIFMMAIERFVASKQFRTYEGSAKNTIYFWCHICYVVFIMIMSALAYDIGASYPASTLVPAGGQTYHQMLAGPLTILEFVTMCLFEYLYILNTKRIQENGFTLTERYKIVENIRMLELLRPVARFHCIIMCIATISYVLFGRTMEHEPSYPIFEETINIIQLQAIAMPLVFVRHERLARARQSAQLERNKTTNGDFASRHAAEFTKGW